MARPQRHNWEEIKHAYKIGVTVDELHRKYGVARKTLQNKISAEKWELDGSLNSQVDEFRESLGKVTGIVSQNPILQEIVEDRLNTITEDNELISNNRKLGKAFQGLIGQGIKSGLYKTPQDIKAGTSTLKDIESIANPQASRIEINNANMQQNETKVLTIGDLYD